MRCRSKFVAHVIIAGSVKQLMDPVLLGRPVGAFETAHRCIDAIVSIQRSQLPQLPYFRSMGNRQRLYGRLVRSHGVERAPVLGASASKRVGHLLHLLVVLACVLPSTVHAAGQTPERIPTVDERLDASFNQIFNDPEVAKRELENLQRGLPKYSKGQKAKFHNVYAVFQAVTGREDLAEKSFLKSLEYTDAEDPSRANTLNNLAIIHKNRGDYKGAFALLDQSLQFYEETDDAVGVAKNHSERASIYKLMGLQNFAVDYLLLAVKTLEGAPKRDDRVLLATQQRLANTYLAARDLNFALKLYDEVLPKFLAQGNQLDYAATLLNKAECLYQLSRYTESLQWVNKALPLLKRFENQDLVSLAYLNQGNALAKLNPAGVLPAYAAGFEAASKGEGIYGYALTIEYARALLKRGNTAAAINAVQTWKGKRNIKNEDGRIQAKWLALEGEIAARAGNFKAAQQLYERSFALRDSLFDTEVFEQSRALQEKFKSDLLQEENDQMTSDLRWNRVVAILATVLALAIAGIAAYRVYVSRLKTRLRASEVLRLEHEAQMLGENVQLKEEIISQQKSQLISSALETSQWMEKFQTLAAKADSMGIQSLRDDIEAAAAQDKHWSVFIERFRQLNPNFMEMLSVRFPELTKGELEFCSMARMNLSFKEIAHLLNISHQSVHMKKYRITKKMNLEADDDFYTLLRSL